MSITRPLLRTTWRLSSSLSPSSSFISRRNLTNTSKSPTQFPTIESCPSPTCTCQPTPAMPEGLPIDREKPLNGTMAAYAEQLLICTGKDDWMSRIEEEDAGDNLAADVKELVGRGGEFADPYHNILITNASFPSTPTPPTRPEIQNTSAYLLPSFKYIPHLPRLSFSSVQALVQGYLLPPTHLLNAAHNTLSPIHRDRLSRKEEVQSVLSGVRDVNELLVLICGHGGRDARCGVLGPVLRREFRDVLRGVGMLVDDDCDDFNGEGEMIEGMEGKRKARVGLISHIGGHKWAGNVIIYIPPGWRGNALEKVGDGDGSAGGNINVSPLAGKGIWYGRVEPKHVEGIVRETILGGKVVKDMFRGGVGMGGEILRL